MTARTFLAVLMVIASTGAAGAESSIGDDAIELQDPGNSKLKDIIFPTNNGEQLHLTGNNKVQVNSQGEPVAFQAEPSGGNLPPFQHIGPDGQHFELFAGRLDLQFNKSGNLVADPSIGGPHSVHPFTGEHTFNTPSGPIEVLFQAGRPVSYTPHDYTSSIPVPKSAEEWHFGNLGNHIVLTHDDSGGVSIQMQEGTSQVVHHVTQTDISSIVPTPSQTATQDGVIAYAHEHPTASTTDSIFGGDHVAYAFTAHGHSLDHVATSAAGADPVMGLVVSVASRVIPIAAMVALPILFKKSTRVQSALGTAGEDLKRFTKGLAKRTQKTFLGQVRSTHLPPVAKVRIK